MNQIDKDRPDKIVNGILCFKAVTNGNWIPYSHKALTEKLVEAQAEIEALKQELYHKPEIKSLRKLTNLKNP